MGACILRTNVTVSVPVEARHGTLGEQSQGFIEHCASVSRTILRLAPTEDGHMPLRLLVGAFVAMTRGMGKPCSKTEKNPDQHKRTVMIVQDTEVVESIRDRRSSVDPLIKCYGAAHGRVNQQPTTSKG